MSDQTVPDATAPRRASARGATSATPLWLAVTLAILFGLFYAYDAWEAVGNLVISAQWASALDTTFSVVGWVVLIGGIVAPVALFAIAFTFGRRRGPLTQAAFYAVGLGVSAIIYLDLISAFGLGNLLA